MMKQLSYTKLLVSAIALFGLTACEPAVISQELQQTKEAYTGYSDSTAERLDSAAKQAVRDGDPNEAVQHYEKLYKLDSGNPDTVLNYAAVLRQTGNPERASVVLAPYVDVEDTKKGPIVTAESPDILLEYASAKLAMGEYEKAEILLQGLLMDPRAPELAPQAHNLIAVSLDSRGRYRDAEAYYEQAMDLWIGAPVNVMNNLALNLSHQGYFDDSLNLLRQALVMVPDNGKVAANIDFVRGLQQAVQRNTTTFGKP